MQRDENARCKACVYCLEVLKELANLDLRFRDFKDKNTLWPMYLKVENHKHPTKKVRRS